MSENIEQKKNEKEPDDRLQFTKDEISINEESSFFDLRTKRGQILFFLITVLTCLLIQSIRIDDLKQFISIPTCNTTCPESSTVLNSKKPTYWIYDGMGGEGHLIHVKRIISSLGFERVTENDSETADLLWAHDFPFNKLRSKIAKFKAHQRVNHFPGCGFITSKVDLSLTNMKYIPNAFRLPEDEKKFKEYAEAHPEKLFVVKNNQHRQIKVQKVNEINFGNNETFIQEFISNPLLVDGHKFDIGVYVIITSYDPLRVYIYNGDILFRYCPEKYYPFDAENLDKYVVGDDYLPTWQVGPLAKFYNTLGLGMKQSFDAYLQSQGKDPKIMWSQVEDAIRTIFLKKEPLVMDVLKRYKFKQNFFEMMRLDLIVDENLNVYLIEVNMSPNLSSAHFKENSLLYEQVIYSTLSLVGVGSYVERSSFEKLDATTEMMISADKNVMINGHMCSQVPCSETCSPVECELCRPCISRNNLDELHRAYREHFNRAETKRIFPNTNIPNIFESEFFKALSPKNQMMTRWFYYKCKADKSWCS